MREAVARSAVLLVALVQIAMFWYAGVVRERLGWGSLGGNMVWLALGIGALSLLLAQAAIYWTVVARPPANDLVASVVIIAGPIIGAGIGLYYAFKRKNVRRNRNG